MFHSEVDHICFRNVLVLGSPILLSFPVCEPRVSGIMERFLNSMTSINPVQKSLYNHLGNPRVDMLTKL